MAGARRVLALAKFKEAPAVRNSLDYSVAVAQAGLSLTAKQRSTLPFDFKEWALKWRDVSDRFDRLVEADPMILYEPANEVAMAFHTSPAFIRYFRAGNRTSKTQSGYAEHYFVSTGQHKWRPFGPPPNASAVIAGLPFTQYTAKVFEPKFLTGEQDNPLSPIFPIGGKWFYHYDERRHVLTIACPRCAEAGAAGSCGHQKSTITLFSSEQGFEVLQGAVYTLVHFDEDTPEAFFNEARQRLKTASYPSMILTGTPLHGDQAWEQRIIASIWKDGPPRNLMRSDDPTSPPLVSLHTISMWDAGVAAHDQIQMEASLMDEFEYRARIMGEPLPLARNPVFDRRALKDIKDRDVRAPQRGEVHPTKKMEVRDVTEKTPLSFTTDLSGPLRVWKHPEPGEVYVAAVDTAAGLSDRDASCCSILRIYPLGVGVGIELVAQFHGWLNPNDYADALVPLCYWYNAALMVIELTGGLGRAVMLRVREAGYWNLYREQTDTASVDPILQTRMGVETSATRKPFMVASLQSFIKDRKIIIPCEATIHELTAYEQETKGEGGIMLVHPRYRGAGGTHDDRVMSLAIGASTVITYPQLLYAVQYAAETKGVEVAKAKVTSDMNTFHREQEAEQW